MVDENMLSKMVEIPAVSGYEQELYSLLEEKFSPFVDECCQDNMKNFIGEKNGTGKDIRIMLAAHQDEIGLMVKKIEENGFIRVASVGGIDPRTLPSQRVRVHGKEKLQGVIGAMPPHLLDREERDNKAHRLKDLYVDTGYEEKKVRELVRVGDIITIDRNLHQLNGKFVCGKALDDRAGVLMLYECARELSRIKHKADVYFVATSQEEVGLKGGFTSSFNIDPQIGIAVDVTHGIMPGVEKSKAVEMEGGAVISLGPHVHPDLFQLFKDTAINRSIPHQIQPTSSPYGTDAAAIQVVRGGTATALISIPQRYMHTSVETISLKDVRSGAQLMASAIAEVDEEFLEGLTCY